MAFEIHFQYHIRTYYHLQYYAERLRVLLCYHQYIDNDNTCLLPNIRGINQLSILWGIVNILWITKYVKKKIFSGLFITKVFYCNIHKTLIYWFLEFLEQSLSGADFVLPKAAMLEIRHFLKWCIRIQNISMNTIMIIKILWLYNR